MNILIVDDSKTMRTIIKRSVDSLGSFNVIEAGDGAVALQQFQESSFDVVLSDWNMPNMDGLEFLTAVRGINKDIPFIMITTEAERSRVVTAIQAGVSDYLTKPFTPEDLQAKLRKWTPVAG